MTTQYSNYQTAPLVSYKGLGIIWTAELDLSPHGAGLIWLLEQISISWPLSGITGNTNILPFCMFIELLINQKIIDSTVVYSDDYSGAFDGNGNVDAIVSVVADEDPPITLRTGDVVSLAFYAGALDGSSVSSLGNVTAVAFYETS